MVEPVWADIRRRDPEKRVQAMRQHTHWRWHLDEVMVKVSGQLRYLWRAVDHQGEVLESYGATLRDKTAALKFIKKAMKRGGRTRESSQKGYAHVARRWRRSTPGAGRCRYAAASTIGLKTATSPSGDASGR